MGADLYKSAALPIETVIAGNEDAATRVPKQESSGARAIGWSESDIQVWLKWLSEESSGEVADQFTGTQANPPEKRSGWYSAGKNYSQPPARRDV